MANLDEAFNLTQVPKPTNHIDHVYGYICRVCGGCMNYHKTRAVQSKRPHKFVEGIYRELLPAEQYPSDEETGCSYVNSLS